MHALIIEDEALIALTVQDVLSECGYRSFDLADSVAGAIAAAQNRRPDLITADVQLSPGSGVDAVDAIQSFALVPVIFISGTPADVQRRRPLDVIVRKPFDHAQLVAAVRLVTAPSA